MHSKKLTGTAAVLTSAALLLAGCGGGDEASPAPAAAGEPATGTVQWWSWNPNTEDAAKYIDAFESSHPDITVEHRYVPYADYANTLRLALTAGTGPDVFGLQVGSLAKTFAPLAEDLTPRVEGSLGEDWDGQLIETDQFQVDGKQVGLPWMITGAGLLWHNKTVLDQVGAEVPTTLDELTAACDALKAADLDCVVHGGKDAWVNLDVFQALSNDYAPGKFYEAVAGEADFTDPEFVDAMTSWKALFDDGVFQEGALGVAQYPDANDAFGQGKAGFIVMGSWHAPAMTKTGLEELAKTTNSPAAGEYEFLPTVFPDVSGDGKPTALFGGPDVGWSLAAKSDAKDAGYALIDWLTSQPEGQEIMGSTLQQPALKAQGVDTSGLAYPTQVTAMGTLSTQLSELAGARQLPDAELETALGDALSAVAAGSQSPEEALAKVQAVSESLER